MIYRFEDFELHAHTQSLYCDGAVVPLRPKAWALLLYLLTHRDRVVTKQELSEQLWTDQFVSDSTVESTVAAVRQALHDTGQTQRLIQTQHRRRYRFIASVEVISADTDPLNDRSEPIATLARTSVGPSRERKLITALCGTISPPLTQLAAGALDGNTC